MLILLFLFALRGESIRNYYVSTQGSDKWSGTLPDPNPGLTDGPFATLSHARDVVRTLQPLTDAVNINVRSGFYYLSETLALQKNDSGTAQYPIVYLLYPGDQQKGDATFSGGIPITTWQLDSERGYYYSKLDSTTHYSTQLFVNGGTSRAIRARTPNTNNDYSRGYSSANTLHWTGPLSPCNGTDWGSCPDVDKQGFVFQKGDINSSWSHLNGIDVLTFFAWTAYWRHIGTVYDNNQTLLYDKPTGETVGSYVSASGKRYILENYFEALDAPNEWFYDKYTTTLYYIPLHPGDPAPNAIFSQLDTLVTFDTVSYVTFNQLKFSHTTDGGDHRYTDYWPALGAIQVSGCTNLTFNQITISHTGSSGLILHNTPSTNILIQSALIQDIGGEGISLLSSGSSNIFIYRSTVNDVGFIFLAQTAIIRLMGNNNIVAQNNDVSYGPYGGILVGWQDGWPTPTTETDPLPTPIFITSYNYVHDYGLGILNDFGGIYISSNDNTCWKNSKCALPTLVYQNIITKSRHFSYGSNGVYMDEQVGCVYINNNLIYDTGSTGIYFHCGQNNSAFNNILTYNAQLDKNGYLSSCNSGGNPTYPDLPVGFNFTHNIVDVMNNSGTFTTDKDYRSTFFNYNLYWNASATPLQFPSSSGSFSDWQKGGQDENSLIADPLFVNPTLGSNSNFSLQPNSPAYKLGWIDINYEVVGP